MTFRFSTRTGWSLAENPLTRETRSLRAAGVELLDLTLSNPTVADLEGPAALVELLATPEGRVYRPEPLGLLAAREAIAADAAARGRALDPSRLVLSASTSEAYTWIWKLLAEPGDEVLVPSPSYPLFSYLCDVEGVRAAPYPLLREEGFRLDLGAVERAIGPRTRAIVVVHPNNPTGTLARRDDAEALDALAASRGVAVVSDEVFGDYVWGEVSPAKLPTFATARRALTFVLSGLSKVVCAPQLKLGWMSVHGEGGLVDEAMRRLEVVADTFLSVSTPVQAALPSILARRGEIQAELRARLATNLALLDATLGDLDGDAPVRRLAADGGWSVILEIARTRTEDEWVLDLLRQQHVLVQPGYFFDMDREGFLVASLLPRPDVFAEGARRLAPFLARG